jgi:hypothetical protein
MIRRLWNLETLFVDGGTMAMNHKSWCRRRP